MLRLHWAQLGVKLSPKVPSWGMLELLVLHGFNLESICIALNPISAQHLGPTLASAGPKTAQLGVMRGGQVGTILRIQRDALKTCTLTAISNVFTFFGFDKGFVQRHVAHIGPVLGPTLAPEAPTQDQVAYAKPNLHPNVPSCAVLHPSWAQVGAKWPEFGWAQVGS